MINKFAVAGASEEDVDWAARRALELQNAGGSHARSVEQAVFELEKRIDARVQEAARIHRERLAAEDAAMRERSRREREDREAGRPTLKVNSLGAALRKAGVA